MFGVPLLARHQAPAVAPAVAASPAPVASTVLGLPYPWPPANHSFSGEVLNYLVSLSSAIANSGVQAAAAKESPLSWWCQNRTAYPLLCDVAALIYSVAPTASSAERVFSRCGFIKNDFRTALADGSFDAAVMVAINHRLF